MVGWVLMLLTLAARHVPFFAPAFFWQVLYGPDMTANDGVLYEAVQVRTVC